ncbi:sacsin N-terminal ATP-binding-like domain-containing protein, partial [Methylovulum psychrotolerans]|uniref:sacsin N-terminal ATP-binding-like domain-containing protein n=1 Tax=Methylovulum psychrotolerans TaxID=1704499 RepID=UPI001B80744E
MIESIEAGRKEDGNRSIAEKIIKRLGELNKTVENNQGRWAWELLQNAKDSIAEEDRTVSVQIILDEKSVEFRHNGTHFTERDIRGLINQISSKEVEEGEHTKRTGRFGTGFLTTHLLSKVVQIKGIVKTESNDFYTFQFPLDRLGATTSQLIPKIENAWTEFHRSAKKLEIEYDHNQFNTSFCYLLDTAEQKEIARIGLNEFSKLIPFVLSFIPKISCVDIMDNTMKLTTTFISTNSLNNNLITAIEKNENGETSEILILQATDDRVTVATEVEKTKEGFSVKCIKNLPKLFCDFPLIGTENFHFPVIVNSFFFHPQTERDGVWLKSHNDDTEVRENQELLKCAVELYKNLISEISKGDFFDLYNLAETKMPATNDKYFDEAWYKDAIQKPIREFVFNAKIVEPENAGDDRKSIKELRFPLKSYTETIQNNIWQFTFDLFPSFVCKKEHVHNWC